MTRALRCWCLGVAIAASTLAFAVGHVASASVFGPDDCNSSAFSYFFSNGKAAWAPLTGSTAAGGYSYYINPNGLPQGSTTAQQLIYAHDNWNNTNIAPSEPEQL